jgi:hypothetical protein
MIIGVVRPALPGRSINASGSRVVSHQAPRGWNPLCRYRHNGF